MRCATRIRAPSDSLVLKRCLLLLYILYASKQAAASTHGLLMCRVFIDMLHPGSFVQLELMTSRVRCETRQTSWCVFTPPAYFVAMVGSVCPQREAKQRL